MAAHSNTARVGKRALIISANPALQSELRLLLTEAGFGPVFSYPQVERVLSRLATLRLDVAVVDCTAPEPAEAVAGLEQNGIAVITIGQPLGRTGPNATAARGTPQQAPAKALLAKLLGSSSGRALAQRPAAGSTAH